MFLQQRLKIGFTLESRFIHFDQLAVLDVEDLVHFILLKDSEDQAVS